jgi:hypothetical protein
LGVGLQVREKLRKPNIEYEHKYFPSSLHPTPKSLIGNWFSVIKRAIRDRGIAANIAFGKTFLPEAVPVPQFLRFGSWITATALMQNRLGIQIACFNYKNHLPEYLARHQTLASRNFPPIVLEDYQAMEYIEEL